LVEIRQITRRAGGRWKPVDIALPDNAAAHGDEAIFLSHCFRKGITIHFAKTATLACIVIEFLSFDRSSFPVFASRRSPE
jgi:hypothetical protein